jgi:UDPglucose--hexose-1-phosphate uridylyltransferase
MWDRNHANPEVLHEPLGRVSVHHGRATLIEPMTNAVEHSKATQGARLRFDRLTHEWVVIAADRQRRPNLPTTECPFCPGGLEAPTDYTTRTFPNRWPPLQPGVPIDLDEVNEAVARGAAEVVLYSPDHDASLASIGVDGVRRVIEIWTERTQALLQRPEVEYVLVFENRGEEAGATIPHPHGQIYAFPFVPPVPARERAIAAEHGCPLCAEQDERSLDLRLVARNDEFVAYTRAAAGWPYELLVAPRRHLAGLADIDEEGRGALAEILCDVLGRYERLFDEPLPYMLWIHPGVHLHIHLVTPLRAPGVRRFVAAGELGSGVMFNPVSPETSAAQLSAAGATDRANQEAGS